MNVLAFDTALGRGAVAVSVAGRCAAQRVETEQRALAERLLPMIEETLDLAGIGYRDLDRIGVTVGPGTYTGLRIGVAAARGLGLATGLPVIGVTTLEALAQGVREQVAEGELIAAAVDARRGQLYLQLFRLIAEAVEAASDPMAIDPAAAAEMLGPFTGVTVGPAASVVGTLTDGRFRGVDGHADIAPMVVAQLVAMRTPDGFPPRPLYLRKPDAKISEKRQPL